MATFFWNVDERSCRPGLLQVVVCISIDAFFELPWVLLTHVIEVLALFLSIIEHPRDVIIEFPLKCL